MIKVQEIDITKKDQLDQFYEIGSEVRERNNDFELPWSENRDIQDLIDANQLDFKLFTAKNEDMVGRVMAYRFKDSEEKAFLGWFECDQDDKVSNALLSACENWLKDLNVKSICGPMNGSSWGSFRFNTGASKPLFATEPYQPLYYLQQWEKFGFSQDVKYESHLVPKEISRPMRLFKLKAFALMKGVHFNTWPKNLIKDEQQLKNMHVFFHECFQDNPLYRPITFAKYKEITLKLEKIIDFEHSYILSDKKGKPASVLISYKDVYHQMYKNGLLKDETHKTHTLYMKTICTAKNWRGKHLSRVLVNFGFVEALKNGYQNVVFGTMMTENKSAKYSKSFFEAEALRTYSFMKKEI